MFAQAGKPIAINYTSYDQDPGLSVRASIWDITTGSPSLVAHATMFHVEHGAYCAVFTPAIDKLYAVVSMVFTDGTFTTPDPNRAAATEVVQSIDIALTVATLFSVKGFSVEALVESSTEMDANSDQSSSVDANVSEVDGSSPTASTNPLNADISADSGASVTSDTDESVDGEVSKVVDLNC